MTLQDKGTRRHRGKVVEVHAPIPKREQKRFHLVKRRARNAPWWIWTIGLLVLAASFGAGWLWPSGRSSVLAEQLDRTETELEQATARTEALETEAARAGTLDGQVAELQEQLEEAPDPAAFDKLTDERNGALLEVWQKDMVIAGWAGFSKALEIQNAHQEQMLETQEIFINSQSARANTLQQAETARIAALPGQIVANLEANPPAVEADYSFTILQETIEEAFGQRFFGWLDELKWVTAKGNVQFRSEGAYSARNTGDVTEVRLPLPVKAVHGLHGFTRDSFGYEPGFLARTDVQDVSDLIVWVEHEYLVPRACADIGVMRNVIANAEAQTQTVAGERPVELVWVSRSGQESSTGQLTDSVLLANAC